MPLINGQKMACEPCIRGHRSTKCTHANERLMVPVRKPGRPLSSCPHPPGRGCGCGGVTAAIPRKQKCGCGTSASHGTSVSMKTEPLVTETNLPRSPTKSSFRVQKTNGKPIGKKQSYDPANLERINASHINILSQPQSGGVASSNTMQPLSAPGFAFNLIPQAPDGVSRSAVSRYPGNNGFVTGVTPMNQQVMSIQGVRADEFAEDSGKAATGAVSVGRSATAANMRETSNDQPSCCSGTPNTQPHTSSPGVGSVSMTAPKVSSCCSSKQRSVDAEGPSMVYGIESTTQDQHAQGHFQQPVSFNQALYSDALFQEPTVFTYPPSYGSSLQPLRPDQWRQTMATAGFAQPTTGSVFSLTEQSLGADENSNNLGTTHQCSCGASCQCVGCAAHPYNEATQDYIRSAWNIMHENPNSETFNGARNRETNEDVPAASLNQPQTGGDTSPQSQTPSDTTSGFGEEQPLSAADYFFVTYPMAGSGCAGDTTSCPCGDDCECIGCTIHNNQFDPVTGLEA